jgi:tRNA threonylcarbamoyladenosine modification (KEOPS) complex  Pcc1 subunit
VFKISINVGNEKIAEIVSRTIAVDRELNEPIVEKSITNSHTNTITLLYKSKDAKKLRSAIKNTVENIMLSL